jgi:hypothetical protein
MLCAIKHKNNRNENEGYSDEISQKPKLVKVWISKHNKSTVPCGKVNSNINPSQEKFVKKFVHGFFLLFKSYSLD